MPCKELRWNKPQRLAHPQPEHPLKYSTLHYISVVRNGTPSPFSTSMSMRSQCPMLC